MILPSGAQKRRIFLAHCEDRRGRQSNGERFHSSLNDVDDDDGASSRGKGEGS